MNKKNSLRRNSRGQMEAFGLAVIVILISIGFFIFMSFKSHDKVDNPKNEFEDNKLTNDFVLAILRVNVAECPQYTVEQLIVDCARDRRIICSGNVPDSCIAVNNTVTKMLNETFMSLYVKRFRFYSENLAQYDTTTQAPRELFNISFMNCTSTSNQGRLAPITIPLYPAPGNVNLYMGICTR